MVAACLACVGILILFLQFDPLIKGQAAAQADLNLIKEALNLTLKNVTKTV
jgi:hypothetical protein